mgnify:CR=1 FL=1
MPSGLPKRFRLVCQYRVKNGKACDRIVFNENLWQSSGVVYARTWRKKVLYIGKADGKLSRRIAEHFGRIPKYVKSKDVNYRKWANGKTTTIWAFKPKSVKLFGLRIPIHAGAEAALIKKFKPPYVSRI